VGRRGEEKRLSLKGQDLLGDLVVCGGKEARDAWKKRQENRRSNLEGSLKGMSTWGLGFCRMAKDQYGRKEK